MVLRVDPCNGPYSTRNEKVEKNRVEEILLSNSSLV